NALAARTMIPEDPGLILSHLLRDLGHYAVDGGIHVVALVAGLDGDVVRAVQHDFGEVPMFRYIQNDVRFDDAGIIEMDVFEALISVILNRLGDGDIAAGDADGDIDVGGLHGVWSFRLGDWKKGSGRLHLERFAQIHTTGGRIVDEKILCALGLD